MSQVFRVSVVVSLSIVLSLFLVHCSKGKSIPKLESPEWFLAGTSLYFSGEPAPSSAAISTITDSIIPALGGWEANTYYTDHFKGIWKIDSAQTWHGMRVYNLFFDVRAPGWGNPVDSFDYHACLAVALETEPGLARLIYLSWSDATQTYFEPTKQSVEAQDTILFVKSPMSGSGGYYDEEYWVWDALAGVPAVLDPRRAYFINERQVIPLSYSTRQPKIAFDTVLAGTQSWTYFNSQGLRFDPAPAARSLDSLMSIFVRSTISGLFYGDASKVYLTWTLDTLGSIHGYLICRARYDVHNSNGGITGGKVITVQLERDLHRLVYLGMFYQPDSELARDGFIAVGDDSLICVKGWLNGLNTYRDNYWLWPSAKDVPISLYQDWVLAESLAKIAKSELPAGLTIRQHRGNWDFHNLSYDTYTWREDDKDEKPSGGKLRIQFGIVDNRLVPTDYTFNPSDTFVKGE